ncbi:ArsR/SmtB family transcription factor [Frigidibacter sp. MR17.24]|uniref:ArsR/SmtB family transcription factor n=1 Tax=Frigidibacter sp. MR17.24 TaxID=3127345 RepID=UPI003012F80A
MGKAAALAALSALGHAGRLDVFRLLMRAGPEGLLAGEIAAEMGVLQNTLSTNLAILADAGMIRRAREGRGIRYFAAVEGMAALVAYLVEDCCGGRPEQCRPLLAELTPCCPGAAT